SMPPPYPPPAKRAFTPVFDGLCGGGATSVAWRSCVETNCSAPRLPRAFADGRAHFGDDLGWRSVKLGKEPVECRAVHRVDLEPALPGLVEEFPVRHGRVEPPPQC